MRKKAEQIFMAGTAAILDEIRGLLSAADGRTEKAQHIAETIRRNGNYRWVGIYEVEAEEIAAMGWTGTEAPKYPRFSKSQGLCGAAASSGATVVVGDVTQDPRYLTTFSSTRSEMIVPVMHPATRRPMGLIDVESERVNAFTEEDRDLLENCAEALTALWD